MGSLHAMTSLERRVNMAAVFLPFAVTAAAIPLLWGSWLGWSDVAVFVFMYLISGLGVTVGFHRMLTHRAFQTHKATRYLFAYLGMLSVQGPVIDWVADHRKHHAHTDVEGDPHSPHVGHGDGVMGALQRPLARARRLAVANPRPGPRAQVRQGPRRGSRHAHPQQEVPADRARHRC